MHEYIQNRGFKTPEELLEKTNLSFSSKGLTYKTKNSPFFVCTNVLENEKLEKSCLDYKGIFVKMHNALKNGGGQ